MRLRISCGSRTTSKPSMMHPAGGGQQDAAQHLERGGLARAVEPEEADDLATLDVEGEVANRRVLAVVLGQPLDLNHGGQPIPTLPAAVRPDSVDA